MCKRAAARLGPADTARGLWTWGDGSSAGFELGAVDYAGRRTLVLSYTIHPPRAAARPPRRGKRPDAGPAPSGGEAVRLFFPMLSSSRSASARVVGERSWLWCSSCQRARATVYLAPGARVYRCRACAGLTYLSKLGGPTGRAERACRKAARRLGIDYFDFGPCGWAPRPKGMRRATYARRLTKLAAVHERRDALFIAGAARILARFPPQPRGRATVGPGAAHDAA